MLLQEYNPEWSQHFQDIKDVIQRVLGGQKVNMEHVGSTSVPGLAAKPIIDIDIVYGTDIEFIDIKKRLSGIGYFHNGDQGIPGRDVFKRKESTEKHPVLDTIKHHLYACPADSEELHRHLLFRDYLKNNNWARKEYQALKFELAKEANQDRKAYAQIKEDRAKAFILSIIDLARKQYKTE